MSTQQINFGTTVVAWQKKHGRHDLPWQNTQDPYAVWLSEIMLQQTQVTTVRDYFARFMARFPTVADLAVAHQDEVLGLWSGLGYYSRARNMHRAAQEVVALHGGVFPRSAESLQTLPGIGRSTAAAVASLCFGEPIAILDGNVKRVLTRYLGFKENLASSRVEKELWAIAQTLLPQCDVTQSMPRYTQGVMDLGATVCTPKKPQCGQCPVANACVAKREGQTENYPIKTHELKRTSEQLWLLQAQTTNGDVWLMQRPQTGVWAGLYCLPVFQSFEALQAALPAKYRVHLQEAAVFKHVLTHKDLHVHPVALTLPSPVKLGVSMGEGQWVLQADWPALGLPAPVRKLLTP
ncbi:A/G-specific adenine glycosylase [Limnohabitans sp.]|uniref:A/G-specific adenine glycosylase n=1 Tax=Limnohabitans sp. TaxID=1907725 RepID=UPI00286EB4C2|nr:A/G-specific adenine glycosylase [Limnohabitans sp.]